MWVCMIALQCDFTALQLSIRRMARRVGIGPWIGVAKPWPARVMTRKSNKAVECPLLAQSGHSMTEFRCPLLGVKRTLLGHCGMSAFDPKRTFWSAELTGLLSRTFYLVSRADGSFITHVLIVSLRQKAKHHPTLVRGPIENHIGWQLGQKSNRSSRSKNNLHARPSARQST